MSRIAVIGIAGKSVFLTVDGFGKTGETTVAKDIHEELGGKGFNQAVAAARWGAEVSFLAAVNESDVFPFTEIAKERGVKAFFAAKKEKSPYAVITTDKNGDNRVCVYRGAELSADDVSSFKEEIIAADILLINNEVPEKVNETAVAVAKEHGVKVILNPAPSRKYRKDFLDKIDLFTPNEHETEGLDGYENIVLTLGAKGCMIKSTGEIVPAAKVEKVADTTGAGDTFNGVLAACLSGGESLKEALKNANAAAAVKVGRKYVLDSIPTKREVGSFDREK